MVRYRGTIKTKYPVSRVWELVANWTNLAVWDMNVKKMTPIDGTPSSGVGAGWDCLFEFNGNKTDAKYKCVLWEPEKKAVFEATSPFVRSKDTIEVVKTEDGGTEVTAEFQLYLRGLLFPFSFVLDGAMQSTCPQVIKDLDKYIDDELK